MAGAYLEDHHFFKNLPAARQVKGGVGNNGSVVISQLCDIDGIFRNFIDESVLIVDTSGPITRKGML